MENIEKILTGIMIGIGIYILEFGFFEMLSSNMFFYDKKKGFIFVLIIKLIVYSFLIYFSIRDKYYIALYSLISGIVIQNLILIYNLLVTKQEQMYMIFKEFEKHKITFKEPAPFQASYESLLNEKLNEEQKREFKLALLKRKYYK